MLSISISIRNLAVIFYNNIWIINDNLLAEIIFLLISKFYSPLMEI